MYMVVIEKEKEHMTDYFLHINAYLVFSLAGGAVEVWSY